jgi:hypothetical protein
MMCAVAVPRQIKPGRYEQFRAAWPHDPWLPRYERAFVMRHETARSGLRRAAACPTRRRRRAA